jgi:hypothetical protein
MRVRQTSTRRVAEVLLVNRLGLRMVLHLVILLATNVSTRAEDRRMAEDLADLAKRRCRLSRDAGRTVADSQTVSWLVRSRLSQNAVVDICCNVIWLDG